MKLLQKYDEIMRDYRAGKFGDENLNTSEILTFAGEEDLFEKMNLSEIQILIARSSGFTRSMFSSILEQKTEKVQKIEELESELSSYGIDDYCDGNDNMDATIAKNLNLEVQYCSEEDLPDDVEAKLCPSTNEQYNGKIMILYSGISSNTFRFIHEIMHYIRDVGIGQRVVSEYTRKSQGNTDSDEEQEINYLTAAWIMPIEEIKLDLQEFEDDEDDSFWEKMISKYKQSKEAITRRFIEVRNIIDYRKSLAD